MVTERLSQGLVLGLLMALAACSGTPTQVGSTALLTVVPAAGATNVDINAIIEVRFDNPVNPGTMQPIALQVGNCPGPVVMGTWVRTADGLGLRFEPLQPLDPATQYTIHVGGGVTGSEGAIVDLDLRGPALGGAWVTREMVLGMTGMGMSQTHSGQEWLSPNGMYGLAFIFTTGP